MGNNKFEKFRNHWSLKFLAITIPIAISLAGFMLQYRSSRHELGGTLNATFHSLYLNNREARTIVVCMEDTSVNLSTLYVTPTFDNPSEFSLKDFSLSFDAECSNVILVPSSFVEAHEYGGDEHIFKYKDNVLAAYDDTKKPFSKFLLKNIQGRCYIRTKASYDGAESAFEYNTDVWFFVVPNKSHLSYEDWKINCKKRIFEYVTDQYYDVYFYANNHETEYQFDVALNKTKNYEESPTAKQYAASSSPSSQNRKEPDNNSKQTRLNNENIQKEDEKPVTHVVVKDNNQGFGLAQCSSSYSDGRNSIYLKYNKPAVEDAKYIFYCQYTTKESDETQTLVHPMEVKAGMIDYEFSYKSKEEFILNDNARLLMQSNAEGLVDYLRKGESTEIRSKSYNDVVVVIYTSADSYFTHLLSPGAIYYTNANNEIEVFDTGFERNKEDIPLSDRMNVFFSNMGYWIVVIYLICFLGYILLGFFIIVFLSELKDRRSFSEAWHEVTKDFSLDELHDTFMTNKESVGTKIWLALCMSSPIFAIAFTIYFFCVI